MRREDIETSIWSDPDFLELGSDARLVYVWSFTNQRCGMAGIYRVSRQAITLETGVHRRALDVAFAQLRDLRFVFYDDRVLFVRTRVKRLRTTSPTIAKAIGTDLDNVGGHPFVAEWWRENGHRAWVTAYVESPGNIDDCDTPSIGHRPPIEGVQGMSKGMSKGNSFSTNDANNNGNNGHERQPSRRADQNALPAELPDGLHDTARSALGVLLAVQSERGGAEPTLRGVGLAVQRFPDRDHAGVALELEHWALAGTGQGKPVRDWAKTYATFLKGASAGSPVRTRNGHGGPFHRPNASELIRMLSDSEVS